MQRPTVARFTIRHSKVTYRLFRNTGNSLSLLEYLNAAVTHEGPAPATGHEVHCVPIRLMQTHTTCRMLPLAILRTQSTPSGCMRKADRHGSLIEAQGSVPPKATSLTWTVLVLFWPGASVLYKRPTPYYAVLAFIFSGQLFFVSIVLSLASRMGQTWYLRDREIDAQSRRVGGNDGSCANTAVCPLCRGATPWRRPAIVLACRATVIWVPTSRNRLWLSPATPVAPEWRRRLQC